MALWGVSGSDVTNCGWNTAVGLGVFATCAVTAYGVKKVAAIALNSFTTWNNADKASYSQYAGAALGFAPAIAAYKFVPGSRFSLISGGSNTMLMLSLVPVAVGLAIDKFVGLKYYTATLVGLNSAAAAHSGYSLFVGLGALGAGFGSGLIKK